MQGIQMRAGYKKDPALAYHAVEAMSSGALVELLKSPLHYQWKYLLGNFEDQTPQMRLGELVHAALLEPERYAADLKILPDVDGRTKAGKEAIEAFKAGLKPESLTASKEEDEKVRQIVARVMAHPRASKVLTGGLAELSGYWTNLTYNLACKSRPDYLHEDHYIIDVKTCRDASPHEFARSVANWRYDVQAAWYTEGHATILHKERGEMKFLWVAVETTAPFGVAVYQASEALLQRGRESLFAALDTYTICRERNQWPSYSDEIKTIDLPKWAM